MSGELVRFSYFFGSQEHLDAPPFANLHTEELGLALVVLVEAEFEPVGLLQPRIKGPRELTRELG